MTDSNELYSILLRCAEILQCITFKSMLAESAFQSASECMLLLHTCMKSTVKMHVLDTIHVNVVLSEPEQWGEIQ